mmetsp:Transcript_78321/g.162730  ORF Transcript_78321/g.162730 Transcript_78321/m.162730 type:complete len:229 (+) Transcript_78321:1510-2196(+)
MAEEQIANSHEQRLTEADVVERVAAADGVSCFLIRKDWGILVFGEQDRKQKLEIGLAEFLGDGHVLAERDGAEPPKERLSLELGVQKAGEDQGLRSVQQARGTEEEAVLGYLSEGFCFSLLLTGHAHGDLGTGIILLLLGGGRSALLSLLLRLRLLLQLLGLSLLLHTGIFVGHALALQSRLKSFEVDQSLNGKVPRDKNDAAQPRRIDLLPLVTHLFSAFLILRAIP